MGRLVGDAPDDDVGAVLVACNHITQLCLCILEGLGVGPGDGPIDGNLRPDEDAHALCLTDGVFVVGIVCQTHEVAAQFLCPGEEGVSVLGGVGTTAAVGLLLMDGDALEEDRLAVEQNLLVAGLDGAETDVVGEGLAVQGEFHPIEFGILRRPQLGLCHKGQRCLSLRICGEGGLVFQFWNAQRHLLPSLCLVQLHSKLQELLCVELVALLLERLLDLQGVVLDVEWRHIHQQHVAGDAAVVPPVEDLRGHILCMALVVHLHDDGVLALLQLLGHIEVESGEATDVVSHLRAVHINVTVVVDRTKVEQGVASLSGMPVKALLEPHRSLVEEQAFVPRVPIGWNGHGGRGVEVILDEVFWTLWLRIAEESPRGRVHAIVIIALFLHIHDVVPIAVQRGDFAFQYVAHQGNRFSHDGGGEQCPQDECQNKMQCSFHVSN